MNTALDADAPPAAHPPHAAAGPGMALFRGWRDRRRARRLVADLGALSDHGLRDIGIFHDDLARGRIARDP